MKLAPAYHALKRRWRHPAFWLGASLPLLQSIPMFWLKPLASQKELPFPLAPVLVVVSVNWILSIAFLGLPFQWTGDDRPQAGFWRGYAQWLLLQIPQIGVLLAAISLGASTSREMSYLASVGISTGVSNGIWLVVISWIVVRAETQSREVQEAEGRARGAAQMVHRNTLSPRLIHDALHRLLGLRDPIQLERGLVNLAVLFRSRLVAQSQDVVPFSKERELAESLLATSPRFADVQCHWAPEAENHTCPSLVLVRCLETLFEQLRQPSKATLELSSAPMPGGLVLRLACHTEEAPRLLAALEAHPTLDAVSRRLGTRATLREPLSLSSSPFELAISLRIAEVMAGHSPDTLWEARGPRDPQASRPSPSFMAEVQP